MLKLLAVALTTTTAAAQITTYQGLDFVHVGNAGNRAPLVSETKFGFDNYVTWGSVSYDYQIMQTETTLGDYAQFLTAYLPHHRPIPNESLGEALYNLQNGPNGSILPRDGRNDWNAKTTWIMAARFANWIHNGRSNDPEAFFGGAYDLSPERFTLDQQGFTLADIQREPGAFVALPTPDEWAKATYYDPDRYGPGEGGYWHEPGSSNRSLIPGAPTNPNAESSRDLAIFDLQYSAGLPVLSYPQTRSPWGLADVSGGWEEALERPVGQANGFIGRAGSSLDGLYIDAIDEAFRHSRVTAGEVGIRLVRIPAPSTVAITTLALAFTTRRR